MIVTTVNPKLFGGNLFLNSTPAIRFFFDSNIDAIRKFKDSVGITGDNTSFAKADTTDSLGKMEIVSISELQDYISKADEEIQDADFLCKVTIERVLKRNGWSYISCGGCSRKLERSGRALRCTKCISSKITGIIRNRVELSVKDDSGCAIFVVFDTEMTKHTSKMAATRSMEANDFDDDDLPQCL